MESPFSWEQNEDTWDETIYRWTDVEFVNNFLELDSAGPKKVSRKFIKKKLKKISEEDKNRFITLYTKINNKEKEETNEVKKVTITLSEIEVVIKEVLKVEITF